MLTCSLGANTVRSVFALCAESVASLRVPAAWRMPRMGPAPAALTAAASIAASDAHDVSHCSTCTCPAAEAGIAQWPPRVWPERPTSHTCSSGLAATQCAARLPRLPNPPAWNLMN